MFSEYAGPKIKEKQRKFSRHSKTHGPHRRNEKYECQECTCKIDKSLNRGTCIKFESHKICVAGNQCDNSDFDFHNVENKESPVIKICCDEGRDDCQQSKPKGTQASFGTTVITLTILLILSILFSRVTVNVVVFVLRVVFFQSSYCVYCDAVHVRCSASGFCILLHYQQVLFLSVLIAMQ